MKKIIRSLLSISSILIFMHLCIEPLYTPTALATPAHHAFFPKWVAHKSLISGSYLGNTQAAIHEAMSSAVDGIEIDIRFSKDYTPFLYHGDSLEELTDSKGEPESYTWHELKKIFYRENTPSTLLKLEDVFKQVGNKKYLFLDIKTTSLFNRAFAQKVADLIRHYHLQETVIVESLNPFFLITLRWIARDILVMYDFTTDGIALGEEKQTQFNKIPWLLKQPFFQKQMRRIIRPDLLGPRFNIHRKYMQSLIKKGYPLILWTIDTPHIAQQLFQLGIKGIQTNKPLTLMTATAPQAKQVYDMGGSSTCPHKIITVYQTEDIMTAIHEAKKQNRKISVAGRRHSMGGQTLQENGMMLDMLRFNRVDYNANSKTVRIQAGATWEKVLHILNQYQRSVKIMQSDTLFTVGGSISVNAHGWQSGSPPISSTIVSMKIITSDGVLRHINPSNNPQLFKAVIGGYGLFGVITEVELMTVPNNLLHLHARYLKPETFSTVFEALISHNKNIELTYARASLEPNHLFKEIALVWYEKNTNPNTTIIDSLLPETLVALKRAIFRTGQYLSLGKKIRWLSEKIYYQRLNKAPPLWRNQIMYSDSHVLWPLYGSQIDILQEYFIPKQQLAPFLEALKKQITHFNRQILNVTIREVKKDTISQLAYAKEDMFGVVCLYSQTDIAEKKLAQFTAAILDETLKLGGSFYLPYHTHYKKRHIIKAYPQLSAWLQCKAQWDPEELFSNQFYETLKSMSIKTS